MSKDSTTELHPPTPSIKFSVGILKAWLLPGFPFMSNVLLQSEIGVQQQRGGKEKGLMV
jgi:hypothetical protein